jgi:hypothetical protein
MMKKYLPGVVAIVVLLGVSLVGEKAQAADASKVSTYAPAEDLAKEVGRYLDEMRKIVADEEEYKLSEGKIARDASTLAVIVLALGLHDQENKYKDNAAALLKAAQDVVAAKDYATAKKAFETLDATATGEGKSVGSLKWEKVAPLPELMKQVPMVHTKLKLNVKGKSFTKKAKNIAGYSATIAAVAQGASADTSATKNADEVKLWTKYSEAMRNDAGEVNAAIHKGDEPAAAKAMKKLNQSCDDCHKVFKPDVISKTNGE